MRRSKSVTGTLNPWLAIPLEDYERHMELPEIGQAWMLSDALVHAVREFRPRSVAIAGCAGGNGFVRLATLGVGRIVGIDFNPQYLAAVRRRLGPWLPGVELHFADIQVGVPDCAPVDLVFAGLILEYVDVDATMRTLRSLCLPGGVLVVVLQRPLDAKPVVSASPYESLNSLERIMRLRDPEAVSSAARAVGLELHGAHEVVLRSERAFEILSFRG